MVAFYGALVPEVLQEVTRHVIGPCCDHDYDDFPAAMYAKKGWLEDELEGNFLAPKSLTYAHPGADHVSPQVRARLRAHFQALANDEYRDLAYSPKVDVLCDRSRGALLAIERLRSTCKSWLAAVDYTFVHMLCLHSRWAANAARNAAKRLQGCHHLIISGMRDSRLPISRTLPDFVHGLPDLRSLTIHCMLMDTLPAWFNTLHTHEITFEFSQTPATHGREHHARWSRVKRPREELTFTRWLSSPSSNYCLPVSLRELDFRGVAPRLQFSRIPPCLRTLSYLSTLWLGHAFNKVKVVPTWFQQLSALERVSIGVSIDVFAPIFRNMSLAALSIDFTDYELDISHYDRLDGALDILLVNSRCATTLLELNLCWWWEALSRFPESIHYCSSLTALNVGNSMITYLPDWLDELPLAFFDMAAAAVHTIPDVLRCTLSLRVLIIDDKVPEDTIECFREARPDVELRLFYA